MASLIRPLRRTLLSSSQTLLPHLQQLNPIPISITNEFDSLTRMITIRNYILEMRKSAIHDWILRLLRREIQYEFDKSPPNQVREVIIRTRPTMHLFKHNGTRHFCKSASRSTNNSKISDKVESSISKYDEAYRQLDNLDFMTATKILFNEPPKKKKFGIDFHLVQLFFVCMPSLAVYLVAQYARSEMRKMDAELEQRKKEEEAKAKEMELKAIEEEEARLDKKILEVKSRVEKLEDAVKEIVVATKQHSGDNTTESPNGGKKKHVEPAKSGEACSISGLKNEESSEK